jgi:hypothetical protein
LPLASSPDFSSDFIKAMSRARFLVKNEQLIVNLSRN